MKSYCFQTFRLIIYPCFRHLFLKEPFWQTVTDTVETKLTLKSSRKVLSDGCMFFIYYGGEKYFTLIYIYLFILYFLIKCILGQTNIKNQRISYLRKCF